MVDPNHILALDACTEQGTAALFRDGSLLGQIVYRQPRAHARLLAPMVQTLLRDLEVDSHELDAVAVIAGPGSYTGLRVAVSTAKGLCLATGASLLSLTSLEMLALKVRPLAAQLGASIVPLIDARRMEAYSQVYDATGNKKSEPRAVLLEEGPFDELLEAGRVIFVGDGVAKAIPLLESRPGAIFIPEWPDGLAHVGEVLQKKFIAGETENLVLFEPFYLKGVRITRPKKRK